MEPDVHGAFQVFLDEAKAIIDTLEGMGVHMRVLGALAFYSECPDHRALYDEMKRVPTDIDFAAYSKDRSKIKQVLQQRGYAGLERLNVLYGMKRHIYQHTEKGTYVDIFYDALDMCHKVDFKNRLQLNPMAISLTDLLLEKLQIVQIAEKDIKDCILLLLEHELGDSDKSGINVGYITHIMCEDWGFYYTFTTNLGKIRTFLDQYDWIPHEGENVVENKVKRLLEAIEAKPKSSKWKLRARVGTKKQWYQDVGGESAGAVQQGGTWTTTGEKPCKED